MYNIYMADQPKKSSVLNINPNTFVGSTYAQIAGVTVTDTDVTLEFVFVHPRNTDQGQVVARITLPRQSAEELAAIIPSTIKQHENGKKN